MNIHFAAKALSGQVVDRNTVLCPGPDHSSKDRSLSVTFDPGARDGFLVHSHANDDWLACRDHVRFLLGLGLFDGKGVQEQQTVSEIRTIAPDLTAASKLKFAGSIWAGARPIGGTIVENYLSGRSIDIPAEVYVGGALRFHAACPFRLDSGETVRLPAMIAAMVNLKTDEFQGVHRTALKSDGSGKAQARWLDNPRKMLGSSKGVCVKLSPNEAVTNGLHIAEGIETALSIMAFGFRPVWAALSAGNIARFPALDGIDALTVFADNDVSRTGAEAARSCVNRWTALGRQCAIWTPPVVDSDFNDVLGGTAA